MSDATQATARPRRKVRDGVVVSDKMEKTVIVVVQDHQAAPALQEGRPSHPPLQGARRANACGIGDRVRIIETRPISKETRWRIAEVLEKAR